MSDIVIYSSMLCGYCHAAKRLFDDKGVTYKEITVDADPALRQQARERSGQVTVPQIWIGERHVGGYTDLAGLDQQGKLDALLGLD